MAVSPFISKVTNNYLQFFLIILLVVGLHRNKVFFNSKIIVVLLFNYSLLIIQTVSVGGLSYSFIYTPLTVFYIPFLIYKIMGANYFKYFLKVLYIISIYTFILWLMQCLFPFVDMLLKKMMVLVFPYSWAAVPRSLLFYTAAWGEEVFNQTLGIYRNSGVFHEPGAYGVFLCMGFVLNYLINGNFFDRKNSFFLICILSTLSTTAYVVIFLLFLFYLLSSKQALTLKILGIIVFLFVSLQIYEGADFLKDKVQSQYAEQKELAESNAGKNEAKSGRFYAFFTSLNLFLEHPFFGRGIVYATSEKATSEMNKEGSYTYGIVGLLSTYGLFFCVYYLYYFYSGVRILAKKNNISPLMTFGVFVGIQLSLSTQVFMLSITFVLLFMLGLEHTNKKIVWK